MRCLCEIERAGRGKEGEVGRVPVSVAALVVLRVSAFVRERALLSECELEQLVRQVRLLVDSGA